MLTSLSSHRFVNCFCFRTMRSGVCHCRQSTSAGESKHDSPVRRLFTIVRCRIPSEMVGFCSPSVPDSWPRRVRPNGKFGMPGGHLVQRTSLIVTVPQLIDPQGFYSLCMNPESCQNFLSCSYRSTPSTQTHEQRRISFDSVPAR